MSRWEPDSRIRLQEAALELYEEKGFAETTVAAVAARAGVTERTYFRHFADKREVLFANDAVLSQRLVDAVTSAPPAMTRRRAVLEGLNAVAEELQPRLGILRRRAPIIAANTELQERELFKLRVWSDALAEALVTRGVEVATARLTADVSIAALNVAAQRWITAPGDGDLAALLDTTFRELRAAVS
jgi:AcrR family transcriptional regulator